MAVLKPATADNIALVDAVAKRLVDLRGLHKRQRGTDLSIPGDLQKAWGLANVFYERLMENDFQITDDEWKALKQIAQWTLDLNCDLRGQPRVSVFPD